MRRTICNYKQVNSVKWRSMHSKVNSLEKWSSKLGINQLKIANKVFKLASAKNLDQDRSILRKMTSQKMNNLQDNKDLELTSKINLLSWLTSWNMKKRAWKYKEDLKREEKLKTKEKNSQTICSIWQSVWQQN